MAVCVVPANVDPVVWVVVWVVWFVCVVVRVVRTTTGPVVWVVVRVVRTSTGAVVRVVRTNTGVGVERTYTVRVAGTPTWAKTPRTTEAPERGVAVVTTGTQSNCGHGVVKHCLGAGTQV
ncbi:hypothetical protein Pmi06nite_18240 [Planotetraspora mira]|uniref:Uncharacterized protein n=1 Tax=Planotetraspora mira TaxID=58121 RepID=A0A8J3TM89_9ACTN|nr:hypothetical protein Pmi06nite_18240 [Planotetraspora mira]